MRGEGTPRPSALGCLRGCASSGQGVTFHFSLQLLPQLNLSACADGLTWLPGERFPPPRTLISPSSPSPLIPFPRCAPLPPHSPPPPPLLLSSSSPLLLPASPLPHLSPSPPFPPAASCLEAEPPGPLGGLRGRGGRAWGAGFSKLLCWFPKRMLLFVLHPSILISSNLWDIPRGANGSGAHTAMSPAWLCFPDNSSLLPALVG